MTNDRGTQWESVHEEDVIEILLRQHDRIREGFVQVKAANRVLARLDDLDATSAEFDTLFRKFQEMVLSHAAQEEEHEFPQVQKGRPEKDLASMGRVLLAVEKIAPTRPHPAAAGSPTLQWAVGPLASVLDRARDALEAAARRE